MTFQIGKNYLATLENGKEGMPKGIQVKCVEAHELSATFTVIKDYTPVGESTPTIKTGTRFKGLYKNSDKQFIPKLTSSSVPGAVYMVSS